MLDKFAGFLCIAFIVCVAAGCISFLLEQIHDDGRWE